MTVFYTDAYAFLDSSRTRPPPPPTARCCSSTAARVAGKLRDAGARLGRRLLRLAACFGHQCHRRPRHLADDDYGSVGRFRRLHSSPRRGGCGSYGRPAARPLSAVSAAGSYGSYGSYSAGCSPATPRHSAALPPPPPEFLLPDICEFNPGGGSGGGSGGGCSPAPGLAPGPAQYASSSVLDDGGSLDGDALSEAMRTRSLPSSVRNRQRPLASDEDLDELYAKVNFSKKRKNRMRHDEAAIIAISKSRSQFLDKMEEADGDAIADNEAVIVYNERTAL